MKPEHEARRCRTEAVTENGDGPRRVTDNSVIVSLRQDLRQARGLPEDQQPLDDNDYRSFTRRYRWLRREHSKLARPEARISTLNQAQQFLHQINRWGFSLLGMTERTLQEFTTIRPGWYQRRLKALLHITIPRRYARRFYNMILGHQALFSEQAGREVSIEEAAQHWYTHYHLPAILLLRQVLTSDQDRRTYSWIAARIHHIA